MSISEFVNILEDNMYITVIRDNDIMFEGIAYDARRSLRGWRGRISFIDDGRAQGFSRGLYIEVD